MYMVLYICSKWNTNGISMIWSRGASPGASRWSISKMSIQKQSEIIGIEFKGPLCIGSWQAQKTKVKLWEIFAWQSVTVPSTLSPSLTPISAITDPFPQVYPSVHDSHAWHALDYHCCLICAYLTQSHPMTSEFVHQQLVLIDTWCTPPASCSSCNQSLHKRLHIPIDI